jgi:hypothetical protein
MIIITVLIKEIADAVAVAWVKCYAITIEDTTIYMEDTTSQPVVTKCPTSDLCEELVGQPVTIFTFALELLKFSIELGGLVDDDDHNDDSKKKQKKDDVGTSMVEITSDKKFLFGRKPVPSKVKGVTVCGECNSVWLGPPSNKKKRDTWRWSIECEVHLCRDCGNKLSNAKR